MSTYARSRLLRYFRTFLYMVVSGLLLAIGGGTFFIYESIRVSNKDFQDSKDSSTQQHHPGVNTSSLAPHNGHPKQPSTHLHDGWKSYYTTELLVVGIVMIVIGLLLVIVGLPFACLFWKRYKVTRDNERLPIIHSESEQSLHFYQQTNDAVLTHSTHELLETETDFFPNETYPVDNARDRADLSLQVNSTNLFNQKKSPTVMQRLFGIDDDNSDVNEDDVTD